MLNPRTEWKSRPTVYISVWVKGSLLLLGMSLISCQCCWTWSDFCSGLYVLAEMMTGSCSPQSLVFLTREPRMTDTLTWLIKQLESTWFPCYRFLWMERSHWGVKVHGLRWTAPHAVRSGSQIHRHVGGQSESAFLRLCERVHVCLCNICAFS